MSKVVKLKNLIEGIFEEHRIDEKAFMKDVSNYNSYGKSIYREGSIYDVAKKLSEIARIAKIHTVRETEDSFDKITVTRNMKELNSYSKEFNKVALEAHSLQQRMEGLYEDMGRVLNRYYSIDEAVDKISDKEAETPYDDLEDKDVDNDGDTDDSDEYLHHKLGTVAKKTEGKLTERSKFDADRMEDFVQTDKFLKYVLKKKFRGRTDAKNLEKMYDEYVDGDRDMEKAYKKIK